MPVTISTQPAGGATSSAPLALQDVEGEPRIRDVDLASRLGFAQPRDIRKLIARHRGALSELGTVHEAEEVAGNGLKVLATFLNKRQSIYVIAKSDTAEATAITIEVIDRFDAYERGDCLPPAALRVPFLRAPAAARTFTAFIEMAKVLGLEEQAAIVAASNATGAEIGINPMVALGRPHLPASDQVGIVTPTQIAKRLGLSSAIKANGLLAERGYQTKEADGEWKPTAKGGRFADWAITAKKHSDGTHIRQLRWKESVVDALRAEMA